jgi:chromosome segregation ATPase
MNSIFRERYEAPVLTNETIEVHLSYLRSGFDAVQAALPVLRDKIDQLSEKVDAKFEALSEKTDARIDAVSISLGEKIDKADHERIAGDAVLSEKIHALDVSLSQKIDKANEERSAGDAALIKKIDALDASLSQKIEKTADKVSRNSEGIAKVTGFVKALLWMFGSGVVVSATVWIAKTLNWIQ